MRADQAIAHPTIRLFGSLFFLVISFFALYNTFLVNRSLEDLRFALNGIQKNECISLNELLSFNLAKEAGKEKIGSDTFASIEYVNDTITLAKPGRELDDAADLMEKAIEKQELERGKVLTVADTINNKVLRFLGLSQDLSKRLVNNKNEARSLLKEKMLLYKNLERLISAEEKQEVFYKMALIDMAALNYSEAISSFNEAFKINPDNKTGINSFFRIAWCEKAMGDFKSSLRDFSYFLERFPNDPLTKNAEFQIANLYRREGNYTKFVTDLLSLSDKYHNSNLAPLALFQAVGSYQYDLNDEESAKQIFKKLQNLYPASEFASAKTFVYQNLFPKKVSGLSVKERIYKLVWEASPLAAAVAKATDIVSTNLVIKMIEGAIKQIEFLNLDLGDNVKIERTDKFLTRWANKKLAAVSKNSNLSAMNISLHFKPGNKIAVTGQARMGPFEISGYVLGSIRLKNYQPEEEGYALEK